MKKQELDNLRLNNHYKYWDLMLEQVGEVPLPYSMEVILDEFKKGNINLHGKTFFKGSKIELTKFDNYVPHVKGLVMQAKKTLLDDGEEYKTYSPSDCVCMMKNYARKKALELLDFDRSIEFSVPSELYGTTQLVVNMKEYIKGRRTFPCGDGCDMYISSHNDIERGGSFITTGMVEEKIVEDVKRNEV